MNSNQELTAVVLAGGKGSRLLPHTADIPKPLVEVGGRPIVEYLLAALKRAGVKRTILAVNHLAEQIESALGDGSRFGLQIEYSREPEPLSTVAPLRLIKDLPDNFIVANGDILTDLDIRALYDHHVAHGGLLTVATYEGRERIDYGVLELEPDQTVAAFVEKPDYSFIVSMGVYVFSRALLKAIPKDRPYGFDSLMLDLLRRQETVHAYPYDGFWLDIGRPADYTRAQAEVTRIEGLL